MQAKNITRFSKSNKVVGGIRFFITVSLLLSGCSFRQTEKNVAMNKLSVILDTDTNNELDDQHAIACPV
jgi:hypothetical protein